MNSIRNDILHCLNECNDDEQELIAAIEHIVDRKGKKAYAVIFDVLANLEMRPQEAEAFWHQIVSHCLQLSKALGRKVSIRTAMFDYLSSVNKTLINPKIVEINQYEKTTMLSKYDRLTGLLNRHYFEELFKAEISRAERHNKDLSVLFFDLDDFKKINDYHGHIAGDQALREVANIIIEEKRDEDIAARYGGEEMVIILPETGKVNTLIVAERIRERVENMNMEYHGRKINLTISGGLASYPFDATDANNLLHDADEALRRAKAAGKNNIMLFSLDKRRYARRSFSSEIKVKEVSFNGAAIEYVRSKNISISGMRFFYPRPINVGAKLQLQIPFKKEAPPHLVVGTVRYVKPLRDARYDVGVAFLEIDRLTRNEILCYMLRNAAKISPLPLQMSKEL